MILLPIDWPNTQVAGSGAISNDGGADVRGREQRDSDEAAKLSRLQHPQAQTPVSEPEAESDSIPELSDAEHAAIEAELQRIDAESAKLRAKLGQAN